MPYKVDRFLHLRYDANGYQNFENFFDEFGFESAGVLLYWGGVEDNIDRVDAGGAALNEWEHQKLFKMALARLNDPNYNVARKAIIVGIEPNQKPTDDEPGSYKYVQAHINALEKLAREIADFQGQVEAGKELEVVVRFASEMNNGGSAYGRPVKNPAAQVQNYIETFRLVRKVFAENAPDVKFAFSPSLHWQADVDKIFEYWPEDKTHPCVDIIGGTWYIRDDGSGDQLARGREVMREYFRRATKRYNADGKKGYGLEELGGGKGQKPRLTDNDVYLKAMLVAIASLNINFAYVALFINAQLPKDKNGNPDPSRAAWGLDVTLKPYLM